MTTYIYICTHLESAAEQGSMFLSKRNDVLFTRHNFVEYYRACCMHVCMYVCMYACMNVGIYVSVYMCRWVAKYIDR